MDYNHALPLCFRVNTYDYVTSQTPFGGFKDSGLGRELYVYLQFITITTYITSRIMRRFNYVEIPNTVLCGLVYLPKRKCIHKGLDFRTL